MQAAPTSPVFMLGLPRGALADIVDRRRVFAFAQAWVAAVAVVLAATLPELLPRAAGPGRAVLGPVPGCRSARGCIECCLGQSWVEQQRRLGCSTAANVGLRGRRLAFPRGRAALRLSRLHRRRTG